MGGCSAPNCSNHSSRGFRCFSFPADPERRMLWRINCRRDDWIPGRSARLCEVHFEQDQFEQKRQDGLKKLKPNAIPTIFDFSKPPKRSRKKLVSSAFDVSPVIFSNVRKRRHHDVETSSIVSSFLSDPDMDIHDIRLPRLDTKVFTKKECEESVVSNGDYNDHMSSISSLISKSEYSYLPEEIKINNNDMDDIQSLYASNYKYAEMYSHSTAEQLTEDNSIGSSPNENDLLHCEEHEEELRQLRLENTNYKRRVEEFEELKTENSRLRKKVEILNCFLKTLLPEEDLEIFEEHFE